MDAETDPQRSSEQGETSRRRLALTVLGSALLVAGIIVVLIAFLPRPPSAGPGSVPTTTGPTSAPSPSASSSDVGTESTSPAGSAPPAGDAGSPPEGAVPAPPVIAAFEVSPLEASCPDDRASTAPLTFDWQGGSADQAWIGVGTNDASTQPYAEVGTSASGYEDIAFSCSEIEQIYTLTLRGPGGTTSASVTVTRVLE